jgi:hypothetical protein
MGAVFCMGRHSDEVIEGKTLYLPSRTVQLPDGVYCILDGTASHCPKAVSSMMVERGAADDYASFATMLDRKAEPRSLNCCSAGIYAFAAPVKTTEEHRNSVVLLFKPRFARHGIDLYICQDTEASVDPKIKPTRTTWFSFVDRHRNADCVPDDVLAIDQPNNLLTSNKFPAVVDKISSEKPKMTEEAKPVSRGKPFDFSGSWLNTRFEGDMEAFMVDIGVGYIGRTAAAAAGYGVGNQTQTIKQIGDAISIEVTFPAAVTQKFQIGNGEQQTLTLNGEACDVVPWWSEDGVLSLKGRTAKGPMPSVKRYFQGEEMVMEVISMNGLSIKRFFSRQ